MEEEQMNRPVGTTRRATEVLVGFGSISVVEFWFPHEVAKRARSLRAPANIADAYLSLMGFDHRRCESNFESEVTCLWFGRS
ncbi:unnamed protein product [Linum trigynum]|uniref:Uncharacterized protein n=1 Tax=Linum trigynum TaxID=586398 RepID=A0AAV2G881_9ROSI